MHLAGLAGEPRHNAELTAPGSSLATLIPLQRGISYSAFFLAAAQLIFLGNLIWSARKGRPAASNPWNATTLEWAGGEWSRTPATQRVVSRGPYEYGIRADERDFVMQSEAGCDNDGKQE
jgi:cytochrome c oxidase subunit 1